MKTIEEITNKVFNEDALSFCSSLPDGSVDCIVTSPPYFHLRNYHHEKQLGQETTPKEYINALADIFMQAHRALKPTGTMFVNIGDKYHNGGKSDDLKPKDMVLIPYMLAVELRERGWYVRQDIIWVKKHCLPESVTDRFTHCYEHIWFFTKSDKYYFDYESVMEQAKKPYEPKASVATKTLKYTDDYGQQTHSFLKRRSEGRPMYEQGYTTARKRDVWNVAPHNPNSEHTAAYPVELIRPCIMAGCPKDGIVLDMFMGSGTTAVASAQLNRKYTGSELNQEYIKIIDKNTKVIQQELPL